MSTNAYWMLKSLFFLAAFAMIATLSDGLSSFLLFSSLLLVITQGRSSILLAFLAVLLGATFPVVGGLVAAGLILWVMVHPTRRKRPPSAVHED